MIALAVEALLASALLMPVVLALRGPVRRAFGARVAYALWAIPAARLLMPPLPEGWRGKALPMLPAPEPLTIYLGEPVATLPVEAAGAGAGWPTIVLALWLAGAAALLLWQAIGYARFRHRVLRNGVAVERVGAITVVQSAAARGPLAFGVLHRVVAFPHDFAARFDADERALALEHELGHHRRGDLVANWIALSVLALHWFNPVAWIAYRAYRADQEMANDADVMARLGAEARHAYGCAIVKAAHGRSLTPACHLNTIKDLKGRLRMLGMTRASRARRTAGAIAGTALALGALGATASGTQAAERMRTTVETATGVELAALDPVAMLGDTAAAVAAPVTVPSPPPVPVAEGKGRRTRVVVTRDGKTETYEGDAARAYIAAHPAPVPPVPPIPTAPTEPVVPPVAPVPPMPALPAVPEGPVVTERNCGSVGNAREMVLHSRNGRSRTVVICTDRIAAIGAQAAARAQVQAEKTRREALRGALAGLEHSRRSMASNRAIAAEYRSEALHGIDEAIAGIREEAAHDD